jgi:ferritin-like metal-binding protein YciE
MNGIVKESKKQLEDLEQHDQHDAGLIASAQRVEHYEIAVYGTACAYANLLGETQAESMCRHGRR